MTSTHARGISLVRRFPLFVWIITASILTLLIFFVSALSFTTFAASSNYIHLQSKLVNSDGTNVTNGNYNFKFEIYSASTGGTLLWSEEQTINVQDGILDINLGSVTSFPSDLFDNDDLYLQILLDTDNNTTNGYEETFNSRMALTSVAYSFVSQKLKGSSASYTADEFLKVKENNTWNPDANLTSFNFLDNTGSSLLYVDSANSTVGIGTTSPASLLKLDVNGNIGLDAFLQLTEQTADVTTPSSGLGRMFARDDGRLYYINSNGDVYDLTAASGSSFWTDAGTYIYPNDVGEYVANTGTGLNITDEGNIYMNGFLKLEGYIEGRGNGDLIIRNYGTASGYDLIITTDDNTDPTDNSSYGNIELLASEEVIFKDKGNVEVPLTVDDTAWNSLFTTNNATGILDALNLLAQSAAGGSEWSVTGSSPAVLHPSDTTRHLAIGGTDSSAPFYFNTDTSSLYINEDLSIGRGSGSDNDYLYFDAGSEYLAWDNTNSRFAFSTDVYTGDLTVNDDAVVGRSVVYTPKASTALPACDASNEGRTYYDSDTHNLYVCSYDSDTSTYVYVDLTAGADSTNYWSLNGTYLYPNQTTYSLVVGGSDNTAPFYFNVSDNNLYLAQDLYIGGADGADDDSLYFDAGNERLYWDESASDFVLTRSLRLDEGILDFDASSAAPASVAGRVYYNSTDGNLYFYDGTDWKDLTAGAEGDQYWQDSSGVLNPKDSTYNFAIGGSSSSAPLYFDISSHTLYIGNDDASADDFLRFDTGNRYLAWDDSNSNDFGMTGEGLFELNGDLNLGGNLTTLYDLVVGGGDLRVTPQADAGFATCDSSHYGYIYYDSDDDNLYVCTSSGWEDLTAGSSGGSGYWSRDATGGFVYPSTISDSLILGGNSTASADFYFQVGGPQNKIIADDDVDFDVVGTHGLYLRSYDDGGSGDVYTISGGSIHFQDANIRSANSGSYIDLTLNATGWDTSIPTSSRAILDAINWLAATGGGGLWYDAGTLVYLGDASTASTDDVAIGGVDSSAPFYFDNNGTASSLTIQGDSSFLKIRELQSTDIENTDDGDGWEDRLISTITLNTTSSVGTSLYRLYAYNPYNYAGADMLLDADGDYIYFFNNENYLNRDGIFQFGTTSNADIRVNAYENIDDGDGWGDRITSTLYISTPPATGTTLMILQPSNSGYGSADLLIDPEGSGDIYWHNRNNRLLDYGAMAIEDHLGLIMRKPATPSVSAVAGGSLDANTTYRIWVTAIDGDGGETMASNYADCTTDDTNLSCSVSWSAVPGADRYALYWQNLTTGTLKVISSVYISGTSYTLTAEDGSSSALPDYATAYVSKIAQNDNEDSWIATGGRFGINTSNPGWTLDLHGNFRATEGAIFNDDGINSDFRVESDNDDYMFFIDANYDSAAFGGGVDTNNKLTVYGDFASERIWSRAPAGDILSLYGRRFDATNMYGFGVADNTLYFKSNYMYKWFIGQNYGSSITPYMMLYSGRLEVNTLLRVNNAAVFNEGSGDYDFRIESDGNTTMFFVDAGLNRVAIGDGSPVAELDVGGGTANNVDGTDDLVVRDDADINGALFVREGGIINYSQGDYDLQIKSDGLDYMFFLDASANSIGINNSTPSGSYVLDVVGRQKWNVDSIGSVPLLDIYTNEDTGSSTVYFAKMTLDADGATPDTKFSFSTSGEAKADISWTGGGADMAEWFRSDKRVKPGYIVRLGNNGLVRKSRKVSDSKIVGVTSAQPGLVAAASLESDTSTLVALTGQVPLIVTNVNGLIKTGNLITSSLIPGVGQKISDYGTTVAKSLMTAKDYNVTPEDCQLVESRSDMHWDNSPYFDEVEQCYAIEVQNLGSQTLVDKVKEEYGLNDTDIITFTRIMVFVDRHFYISDSLMEELIDNSSNDIFPGILGSNTGTNESYWTLNNDNLETAYKVLVPSITATSGQINILNAETLTIGDTALTVDSDGNLSTLGNVDAKQVDTSNLNVKDTVEVSKDEGIIVNNNIAGKAKIVNGEAEVTVSNSYVTKDSIVIVTQNSSDASNAVSYVVDVEDGQFTIKLSNEAKVDLEFSWMVVNNK